MIGPNARYSIYPNPSWGGDPYDIVVFDIELPRTDIGVIDYPEFHKQLQFLDDLESLVILHDGLCQYILNPEDGLRGSSYLRRVFFTNSQDCMLYRLRYGGEIFSRAVVWLVED